MIFSLTWDPFPAISRFVGVFLHLQYKIAGVVYQLPGGCWKHAGQRTVQQVSFNNASQEWLAAQSCESGQRFLFFCSTRPRPAVQPGTTRFWKWRRTLQVEAVGLQRGAKRLPFLNISFSLQHL